MKTYNREEMIEMLWNSMKDAPGATKEGAAEAYDKVIEAANETREQRKKMFDDFVVYGILPDFGPPPQSNG
jgi:hypothetical protein